MEDEGRDRGGRGRVEGEKSKGAERGKWNREGDHGCHTVSYSICCSAEQSGAAGGGRASLHKGGGEGETLRERGREERRGRQSAQNLSSTRKKSTAGQAQKKTFTHLLTHTHSQNCTDEQPGQRVEVKRELVRDGGWVYPTASRLVQ